MDCKREVEARVAFISELVRSSGARGIVFGNSGGKDCALVGILSKMTCPGATLSVMLPCGSKQNFGSDLKHAELLCSRFEIEHIKVDLSGVLEAEVSALAEAGVELAKSPLSNIAPRLRMTTLYAVAAQRGALVAGTGNRSEKYMGYFTKWGDGAFDFDPISDLTVGEIYELLRYLGAPEEIIGKAPSAGLFEGQTDESEMGVTYAAIDRFILTNEASAHDREIIERYHRASAHKRTDPPVFRRIDEG